MADARDLTELIFEHLPLSDTVSQRLFCPTKDLLYC